jgi:hypothetical protein
MVSRTREHFIFAIRTCERIVRQAFGGIKAPGIVFVLLTAGLCIFIFHHFAVPWPLYVKIAILTAIPAGLAILLQIINPDAARRFGLPGTRSLLLAFIVFQLINNATGSLLATYIDRYQDDSEAINGAVLTELRQKLDELLDRQRQAVYAHEEANLTPNEKELLATIRDAGEVQDKIKASIAEGDFDGADKLLDEWAASIAVESTKTERDKLDHALLKGDRYMLAYDTRRARRAYMAATKLPVFATDPDAIATVVFGMVVGVRSGTPIVRKALHWCETGLRIASPDSIARADLLRACATVTFLRDRTCGANVAEVIPLLEQSIEIYESKSLWLESVMTRDTLLQALGAADVLVQMDTYDQRLYHTARAIELLSLTTERDSHWLELNFHYSLLLLARACSSTIGSIATQVIQILRDALSAAEPSALIEPEGIEAAILLAQMSLTAKSCRRDEVSTDAPELLTLRTLAPSSEWAMDIKVQHSLWELLGWTLLVSNAEVSHETAEMAKGYFDLIQRGSSDRMIANRAALGALAAQFLLDEVSEGYQCRARRADLLRGLIRIQEEAEAEGWGHLSTADIIFDIARGPVMCSSRSESLPADLAVLVLGLPACNISITLPSGVAFRARPNFTHCATEDLSKPSVHQ